ncbi:MAG: hypothetical protein ACRCYX_05220 [Dermatophilaceae bacterium]
MSTAGNPEAPRTTPSANPAPTYQDTDMTDILPSRAEDHSGDPTPRDAAPTTEPAPAQTTGPTGGPAASAHGDGAAWSTQPTEPTGAHPAQPTGAHPAQPTGAHPAQPTGAHPALPTGAHPTLPTPVYRSGPAPVALVIGLLGVVFAVSVLLAEATDLGVPWDDVGPWSVVVAGAVILLVGALGLRSSRSRG